MMLPQVNPLQSRFLLPLAWLIRAVAGLVLVGATGNLSCATAAPQRPNIVVVFCDDLGYGDLGCYGHPTIRTPQIDRMADEGRRFTQFYVAASVCTPSRAGLLTGRLPVRSGMCGRRRVLFPDSVGGLPDEEVTVAEALKSAGYDTACVGKWHLGHLPQYLPTQHGFDSYFGIPYSNDMDRLPAAGRQHDETGELDWQAFNVPLLRDGEVVERPADQNTLTQRYTKEAVRFIRRHATAAGDVTKRRPFFLYLAHTMPHIPLFRSAEFTNVSRRGLYGDVVEELDWSVGQVLDTLRTTGLAKQTLVIFTSDNGPWLTQGLRGGSAGLLREGKGSTWEGGMREPAIAWWPGQISPGATAELASTLDILPTACGLAGVALPNDRVRDGYDLTGLLLNGEPSPRREMFYYRGQELYAVRLGTWKAHYITQPAYGPGKKQMHDPPLLYNLEHDPSEQHDLATAHPDVVQEIAVLTEQHRKSVAPVPSQLDR